jgi:hypothetical protein
MSEKKRGRPLKAETVESRLTAENLRHRPSFLPLPNTEKLQGLNDLIASMDDAEQEIFTIFKYSITTSANHAYAMASIGDETMTKEITTAVLKKDAEIREGLKNNPQAGGQSVKNTASRKAEKICTLNKILLERLRPLGPLTLNDVARKIIREWDSIQLGSLLPGEPPTLLARGISGEKPTIKTIGNYIKIASPFSVHRVGKTSLRKK